MAMLMMLSMSDDSTCGDNECDNDDDSDGNPNRQYGRVNSNGYDSNVSSLLMIVLIVF